ncbi:N-acetylmuramoyl-L-alanine amidase family protein [Desulfovibrio inopinatus]|uniref:N-acetylmuramoyl-L-alanine amidase family protein n=1 Tax=Desulfovibrio inopinatus TaxID=102109 RepID=UPI00042967DE|nr:N-acetylmuramoyl-L-alanine amidase [Desulfovibrio inopinatus]
MEQKKWKIVILGLILTAMGALVFSEPAYSQQCRVDTFRPVILVGHSNRRGGAQSARGRSEFLFNQKLAAALADGLRQAGFSKTVLVNFEGNVDSLEAKVRAAKAAQADIVLSIHHDSVQPRYLSKWTVNGKAYRYSDRFSGYSLFVSKKNPRFGASFALARKLGEQLRRRGLVPTLHHAEPIKGENRPLLDKKNGVYQYDGLVVLREADVPAVLIEAGVIVHRDEELDLLSEERQQATVEAVVEAVRAYCHGTPRNG